jgi:diguanylate cyclase (GGDEF)-like protein/putative nucleotidyltransferase with HDIG domain
VLLNTSGGSTERQERRRRKAGNPRLPDGSRAIGIATIVVFGLLLVTAGVLDLQTRNGIDRGRSAYALTRDFEQLRHLVTEQTRWVDEYHGDATHRARFSQRRADTEAMLARLRGMPEARADAIRISRTYDRFADSVPSYWAAVDAGNAARARALDLNLLDPLSDKLGELNSRSTVQRAKEASRRLAGLQDEQDTVLLALPVVFILVGSVLFFLSRASHRARAREAEARLGEAEARTEIHMLQLAARRDALTGLRNHRAFQEDLLQGLGQERLLCLVMFDLVRLKWINETQGHQVGDERLREVAAALRVTGDDEESIYRVGGNQFAVVLRDERTWSGYCRAESFRAQLAEADIGIAVRAGVAETDGVGDKDELVHHADLALISAKRLNRSSMVYSPELEPRAPQHDRAAERREMRLAANALARAVDAKDSYTRSHSETVSNLCVLVAQELGLSRERVAKLRVAGLLHDVGKIGTPDAILNKPGALTDAEYETIKQHSPLGEEIVRAAGFVEESRWIRHHHEQPDGYGYPDGLRGEEIPLESLIIGVADAFEAMTSDRPYRGALSQEAAMAELQRCAGTQFEPACVAALRKTLGVRPDPSSLDRDPHPALVA